MGLGRGGACQEVHDHLLHSEPLPSPLPRACGSLAGLDLADSGLCSARRLNFWTGGIGTLCTHAALGSHGERGDAGEGQDVPDAKAQQHSARHHLLGASLRLAGWHPQLRQLRRASLCFDNPEVTTGDSFRRAPLCLRVPVPLAGPGPLSLPTFLLLLCYVRCRPSGGKPGISIRFGAPLRGLLCKGSEGPGCARR